MQGSHVPQRQGLRKRNQCPERLRTERQESAWTGSHQHIVHLTARAGLEAGRVLGRHGHQGRQVKRTRTSQQGQLLLLPGGVGEGQGALAGGHRSRGRLPGSHLEPGAGQQTHGPLGRVHPGFRKDPERGFQRTRSALADGTLLGDHRKVETSLEVVEHPSDTCDIRPSYPDEDRQPLDEGQGRDSGRTLVAGFLQVLACAVGRDQGTGCLISQKLLV